MLHAKSAWEAAARRGCGAQGVVLDSEFSRLAMTVWRLRFPMRKYAAFGAELPIDSPSVNFQLNLVLQPS